MITIIFRKAYPGEGPLLTELSLRYIIIEKLSNQVIGRCAFPVQQTNWHIPQFGISYFICRAKRGKGYATEAAHAMANLAFSILNAQKN